MYELGIILLTCGVLAIVFPVIFLFYTEKVQLMWWFLPAFFCIMFGLGFVSGTPKKSDVLQEKATYVEELNVNGQDTIRTYSIVWTKNEGK